jgi:hypothetical protein
MVKSGVDCELRQLAEPEPEPEMESGDEGRVSGARPAKSIRSCGGKPGTGSMKWKSWQLLRSGLRRVLSHL